MDHIPHIIDKDMDLYIHYNAKRIEIILPQIADWLLRIYPFISYSKFLLCNYQARQFARRTDSEKLNQMYRNIATYYQLKKYVPAIYNEVKLLHHLLIEAGVFKMKKSSSHDELPEKYLGIVLPNAYAYLHEIHEAHIKTIKKNQLVL